MALLAARDEAELNEQSGIGEKNQQAEMREVLLPSIFGAITAVSERLARLEVKLDEKGRDRMATVEQEELLTVELALAAISARLASIETMLQGFAPLVNAFAALQDSPMAKVLGITNGEG